MTQEELMAEAKILGAPFELVKEVHNTGKLPVVNFAAGGIATPADAALMMQLGADGVFVGSGIFKSQNPSKMAKAIVKATTHFRTRRSSPRLHATWARRCPAWTSRSSSDQILRPAAHRNRRNYLRVRDISISLEKRRNAMILS